MVSFICETVRIRVMSLPHVKLIGHYVHLFDEGMYCWVFHAFFLFLGVVFELEVWSFVGRIIQ